MRGFIEEYGHIMLVVAIVLLLLLFGRTGFASNVKTLFVDKVADTIAENPNNDKQIVMVRYENPDGTFTNYETVESIKKNDGETFSWSSPETDAFQAKSLSYTVDGGKVNKVDVMRKKYTLDVNGYYNSSPYNNTANYGTFELYINGSKVQSTTVDFYDTVRYGSAYEIKNVKPASGYKYLGVYSKNIPGYSPNSPNLKSAVGTVSYNMVDKGIAINKESRTFTIELEFEKV